MELFIDAVQDTKKHKGKLSVQLMGELPWKQEDFLKELCGKLARNGVIMKMGKFIPNSELYLSGASLENFILSVA